MKRQAVTSTAMRSIGYDARQKILEIEFTDESIYQFLPVPPDVVSGLLASDSKGTFFDKRIRNTSCPPTGGGWRLTAGRVSQGG